MGRKKRMEQEKLPLGTIYQARKGGNYYLRYMIRGRRKNVCLKTSDYDEALKEYLRLLPTLQADTIEVVAAHVKVARQLGTKDKSIRLADVWKEYSTHPNRATPATMAEQINYHASWDEFVNFTGNPEMLLHEVTPELAEKFANHLRSRQISVDTHNRKIKHLKKICSTLSDYLHGPNPFDAPTLQRKHREEQNLTARRIGFSPEQIAELQKALDDPTKQVLNKEEIKVVFYLGMYTGQRLKDCILLRWNRIDWTRSRISVTQFKTGKQVSIPVAPQLAAVLKAAQQWKTSDMEYVCPKTAARYLSENKLGKSYGNSLVNIDVRRVIRWVVGETSVKVPGRNKSLTIYGFHSLRHSFVSMCAAMNIPKATVLSIIGDSAAIVDEFYTHVGNEAQIAAVEAVAGRIATRSPQERIDQALRYLDTLPDCPEKQKLREILTTETI